MPVSGEAFKPSVVKPGKQPRYRRFKDDRIDSIHSFLPACYLFYRYLAEIGSQIFLELPKLLVEETRHLRYENNKLLLV